MVFGLNESEVKAIVDAKIRTLEPRLVDAETKQNIPLIGENAARASGQAVEVASDLRKLTRTLDEKITEVLATVERGQRIASHAVDERLEQHDAATREVEKKVTALGAKFDEKITEVLGGQRSASEASSVRLQELATQLRSYREELTSLDGETRKLVEAHVGRLREEAVGANGRVSEQINGLSGNFERISTTLEAIRVDIRRIDEDLGGDKFLKTNDATLAQMKKDLAASVADRKEYQELWAGQKLEAKAIAMLAENRGDPEVQALITQKGLEVAISRLDLQKLSVAKEQLKEALAKYPNDKKGDCARLCANLAYAYVLMAQHYKTSREHVTAVAAEKTAAEILMSVGEAALKAALAAGLSALTAGIAGALMPMIMSAVDSVTAALGASSAPTVPLTSDDHTRALIEESSQARKLKSTGDTVGEKGTDAISGLVASPVAGPLKDPYDFFLEKEAELRKVAAMLAGTSDERILSTLKVQLDREYTVDELYRNKTNWEFLFSVDPSASNVRAVWERISELLAVQMRRLCWRMYCRSQWKNKTFDYTIAVIAKEDADKAGYSLEGPASEWHYKVWTSVKSMPRHWDKICADFKGPEQDPQHPFIVHGGRIRDAQRLLEQNAWISMAAVQCCQIRRPDKLDIDLEKRSHFGGQESAPLTAPHAWTDSMLVYGDKAAVQELGDFLKKIQVAGGVHVAIAEIRFGRGSSGFTSRWSKATGKKGTLARSNTHLTPMPIVKGLRMTVMIGRKDAKGGAARSGGEDAFVHVYRAAADSKTHSDGVACALVKGAQVCWYCVQATKESAKSKQPFKDCIQKFRDCLRLAEVDSASSGSRLISSEGWNFENFPHETSDYVNKPGLYCVRLDPRTELQSGDSPQFHHSDEWWFRINDEVDAAVTPPEPEYAFDGAHAVGLEAVKGTYAKQAATDPDTPALIHVRVDDKVYGPEKVTPSGDTPKEWTVSAIPPLIGGQTVQATATWEASETHDAVQSKGKRLWVKPKHVSVDTPVAGAKRVRGYCDAVEGVLIQVAVNESWQPAAVRLQGVRSAEDGKIAWECEVAETLRTTHRVQARVLPRGERNLQKPSAYVESAVVFVPPATAPTIDQPDLFATKVTGTAMPVFQGKIKLTIAGTAVTQEPSLSGTSADAYGRVRWEVTDFAPRTKRELEMGEELIAIVSGPDGSSPQSLPVTVKLPQLERPTVDEVFAGAKSLSVIAPNYPKIKVKLVVTTQTDSAQGETTLDLVPKSSTEIEAGKKRKLVFDPLTGVTNLTLVKGQKVRAELWVPNERAAFLKSDDVSVAELPKPVVTVPVAGTKEITGKVAPIPVEGATIEVTVDTTVLTNKAILGTDKDPEGNLIWRLSDLTGLTDSRVVPKQEIKATLIRNTAKSPVSDAVKVPAPAKPTVNALRAGDLAIKGRADGSVVGAEIQVLAGNVPFSTKVKVTAAQVDGRRALVWEFPLTVETAVQAGNKITAKTFIGSESSESSDESTVLALPKPIISPAPIPGSKKITGYLTEYPGPGCTIEVKIGSESWTTPDTTPVAAPVDANHHTVWVVRNVPVLTSDKDIQVRVSRNGIKSVESDVVKVPKPDAPSVDPLMAGAKSITGMAQYVPDAKVRVVVHASSDVSLSARADVIRPGTQIGDEQRMGYWVLTNLSGLPDSKTALVKDWRVSAIAISGSAESDPVAEGRRVPVAAIPKPRINRIEAGAKAISGTFDGITGEGVNIQLTIEYTDGINSPVDYKPSTFVLENSDTPPFTWTFNGLTWLSITGRQYVPGYADGLTLKHTVTARAIRHDEMSEVTSLKVGEDPA